MTKIYIAIIVMMLSAMAAFGQPPVERATKASTVYDQRLQAKLNLIFPVYADTATASFVANIGIDSIGAHISTIDGRDWKRICCPKRWAEVGAAAAAVPTIFTGGTFSGNSILKLNTKTLTILDTVGTPTNTIGVHSFGGGVWSLTVKDKTDPSKFTTINAGKAILTINSDNGTRASYGTWQPGQIFNTAFDYNTEFTSVFQQNHTGFGLTIADNSVTNNGGVFILSKDSSVLGGIFERNLKINNNTGRMNFGSAYHNNFSLDSIAYFDAAGNLKQVSKNTVFPGAGNNIYNSDGTLLSSRRMNGNGYTLTGDSLKLKIRDTTMTTGTVFEVNNGLSSFNYDTIGVATIAATALGGIKFQYNDKNNLDTFSRVWQKPDGSIEVTSTNAINFTGRTSYPSTITPSGTTGAQTINKNTGIVNMAAAGTSLIVTNNQVTASTIIELQMKANDPTAKIAGYTTASGSFTIYLSMPPTSELPISFFIKNY